MIVPWNPLLTLLLMAQDISAAPTALSQFCPVGHHWVIEHPRRAYIRSDGTFVRASVIRAHCRENWKGYHFWEDKFSNERPKDWASSRDVTRRWTEEEKERVLEALGDLPETLRNQKTIEHFVRLKAPSVADSPVASYSRGAIILYDEAFAQNKNLSRIITHEIAHHIFQHLSQKDRDSYELATGWVRGLKPNQVWRRPKGYVAEDGKIDPSEDFANNFEYLVFDPQKVKKLTPEASSWLIDRFGPQSLSGRDRR